MTNFRCAAAFNIQRTALSSPAQAGASLYQICIATIVLGIRLFFRGRRRRPTRIDPARSQPAAFFIYPGQRDNERRIPL